MQEIKETTSYRQSLKSRILDTAIRAFAERGVRAVKMDDVAQALGISKRTLYEIYEDKETLLYQGIIKYDQQRKERMRQYADSHNVMDVILYAYAQKVEQSQHVSPQFYTDLQKYPRVLKYLEQEHAATREYFHEFLQRGVREGYFRKDVNYDLLPHLFEAIGRYVAERGLLTDYSFQELFGSFLLVPLRGFCTKKGLQIIEKADF